MNPMPTTCPFCDGGVTVQRLYCGSCQVTIDGAIQKHPGGLEVLASGTPPPNAAELLQSDAMEKLLEDLED